MPARSKPAGKTLALAITTVILIAPPRFASATGGLLGTILSAADAASREPARAGSALDRLVDRTRADLATGKPGDAIRALLDLSGQGRSTTDVPPVTRADRPLNRGAADGSLERAIAGLATAVRVAIETLGPLSAEEARRATDPTAGSGELTGVLGPVISDLALAKVPDVAPLLRGHTDIGIRVPPRPDRSRAPDARPAIAAAAIADALDRYLPLLIAGSGGEPASDEAVEGCDLVDSLPHLCVGSNADNVYSKDASLLIDLGGDDRYTNGAGAAPFLPEGASLLVPVSVNLDLRGHDTYAAGRLSGWTNVAAGQGVGLTRSVGMLLDLGGNDSYEVQAVPPTAKMPLTYGIGQGVGQPFGSGAGFGMLMDGSGDDRYAVSGDDGTADAIVLQGQAHAGPFGIAGLFDIGVGTDDYSLDAGDVAGPGYSAYRVASGQANASFGTAVLHDDGGKDSFGASAGARWVGPHGYPTNPPGQRYEPSAMIAVQGVSNSGLALLLEGVGDTTYSMSAMSEGVAENSVQGQAASFWDGPAVVDDLGGNDVYAASADLTYRPTVVVDDMCRTADGVCQRAKTTVDLYRRSLTNVVLAQGAGLLDGHAYLRDRAGNDEYLATSTELLDVTLDDRLTKPSAPPRLHVFSFDAAGLLAQGFARGAITGGSGRLRDDAGNDRYTAVSHNETRASARSSHAVGEPEAVAYANFNAFIEAQGAQVGELLDLGGSIDRFEARSANPASTSPNPDGALRLGLYWPRFQGSLGGIIEALGDDPRIIGRPAPGACVGYNGYGIWGSGTCLGYPVPEDPDHQSHDNSDGSGRAPSAFGVSPMLAFTADTPTRAAGEQVSDFEDLGPALPDIDAGAVLRTPDGNPLGGETVHFTVQARNDNFLTAELFGSAFWNNILQVDAVTDSSGVARARIPLAFGIDPELIELRLLATFDGLPGRPGLYPRHVALPIEVEAA